MPTYSYKAKNGPDRTAEGELVAGSEALAIERLEAMGYVPVQVELKAGAGDAADGPAFQRIRHRDVNVFTRQLASLVKSGVPILKAMRTVRDQSANRRFKRIVIAVAESVRGGHTLSEALAQHPRIFSQLYVNMVKSGESAGMLDVALLRLADAREREEELRRKIQSALAYPALVLGVGLLTVILMLTVFIPRIASLFDSFDDLPLPTRVLLLVSGACRDHWYWAAIAIVPLFFLFRRATSGGKGRSLVDLCRLRLPVLGSMILEADLARFARTLSLLIRAGVPIDSGLSLSAGALSNTILSRELEQVRDRSVRQGMSITRGLESALHFPVFVRNMTAVGEESGSLDDSLEDVAVFYEGEVERRIAIATSLLEPILILVVGAMVAFLVFAMLMPIFAVTRNIA